MKTFKKVITVIAGIVKEIFFVALFLFSSVHIFGQITSTLRQSKEPTVTLESFCVKNETSIRLLFSEINTQYEGLDEVGKALARNDYPGACTALLNYYEAKSIDTGVVLGPETDVVSQIALDALNLKFTFQGVTDSIPHLDNGSLNWLHEGPNKDKEWSYFLNRMWYLDSLQSAYRCARDKRFAIAFNYLVANWIYANPAPAANAYGAPWRVLEAGLRMAGPWPKAFFGFQAAKEFDPVTRILILMSIIDHAHYLQKNHWTHHNHGVMELNGLTNIALVFPEFKSAEVWYRHAMKAMAEEFEYQSYPDGAMKELTSSYQWVVIRHFNEFIRLNDLHNKILPQKFHRTVELMCNYMTYTSRPDGNGLLNNNADLLNNFNLLQPYLQKYRRPDWEYILSNGKEGERPDTTSVMFPWAGHFIMRNGWGESKEKGDFAFFDAGPWGTSHQHNDKLHLSVFSGGRELLCDAGRMHYKVDQWRKFFNLSASHNVILLDGKGQDNTEPEAKMPLASVNYSIKNELDFCMAAYEGGFNDINKPVESDWPQTTYGKHTRAVLYVKGKYWIVVDNIKTDQPRSLTALWHFSPDCSVSKKRMVVFTNDEGKGNLSIKPLPDVEWSLRLVKGQKEPVIQGWHSPRYNERVASYCAEYKTGMTMDEVTFAWLLTPAQDSAPVEPKVQMISSPAGTIHFRINPGTAEEVEIAIDLSGREAISLSDGTILKGHCAVRNDDKTSVVHGKILNHLNEVILED